MGTTSRRVKKRIFTATLFKVSVKNKELVLGKVIGNNHDDVFKLCRVLFFTYRNERLSIKEECQVKYLIDKRKTTPFIVLNPRPLEVENVPFSKAIYDTHFKLNSDEL